MERPAPPETIDAGAVLLRRVTAADAPELADAIRASLDHLGPWMPWAHADYGLDDARGFARKAEEQWRDREEFHYAIRPGGGAAVGAVGLLDRIGPGTLEVGYWLHRGHTGKGYVTTAVRALAGAAFALPGVVRLVIKHDAANRASGAVPARLGYTEVGCECREPEAPGETGTLLVWELRRPAG